MIELTRLPIDRRASRSPRSRGSSCSALIVARGGCRARRLAGLMPNEMSALPLKLLVEMPRVQLKPTPSTLPWTGSVRLMCVENEMLSSCAFVTERLRPPGLLRPTVTLQPGVHVPSLFAHQLTPVSGKPPTEPTPSLRNAEAAGELAVEHAGEDRRELVEARRRHADLRAAFDGLIRRAGPGSRRRRSAATAPTSRTLRSRRSFRTRRSRARTSPTRTHHESIERTLLPPSMPRAPSSSNARSRDVRRILKTLSEWKRNRA